MKKLLLILSIIAISCGTPDERRYEFINGFDKKSRIKLVETVVMNSNRYSIIKIDSSEFFVTNDGCVKIK